MEKNKGQSHGKRAHIGVLGMRPEGPQVITNLSGASFLYACRIGYLT